MKACTHDLPDTTKNTEYSYPIAAKFNGEKQPAHKSMEVRTVDLKSIKVAIVQEIANIVHDKDLISLGQDTNVFRVFKM